MYLEIFLVDFAVFRVFLGISRVRDRAKYQKPCLFVKKIFIYCKRLHVLVILEAGVGALRSRKYFTGRL